MIVDIADLFQRALAGRGCTVTRREHDWDFQFGDHLGIAVAVPWRLVASDHIALTANDDKQWFGLSEPVDAEARANALLDGAVVERVRPDAVTADLAIWLSNGLRLDIFNNSTGYEGWQASLADDGKAVAVIAMGGGDFSIL